MSPEEIRKYREQLKATDARSRHAAVAALKTIDSPGSGAPAEALLHDLEARVISDEDLDIRLDALRAIAAIFRKDSLPQLTGALQRALDVNVWQVRSLAAELLRSLASELGALPAPVFRAVTDKLADTVGEDPALEVREGALVALCIIEGRSAGLATELLKVVEGNDSSAIRQRAAGFLGQLPEEILQPVLDGLWKLLPGETDWSARSSMALALLNAVADPATVIDRALTEYLSTTDAGKFRAAATLMRMRRPNETQMETARQKLWQALMVIYIADVLSDIFDLFIELVGDPVQVVTQLSTDRQLAGWKRSILIRHQGLRQAVNDMVKGADVPPRLLGIMLGALSDTDAAARQSMIDWLLELGPALKLKEKEPELAQVSEALWACQQRYGGQGLGAFVRLGRPGIPTALDRVLMDAGNADKVGGILLREADDALQERWNEQPHRVLPFLLAALKDDQPATRHKAIRWLQKRVDDSRLPAESMPEIMDQLHSLKNEDPDVKVRARAEAAFGEFSQRLRKTYVDQIEGAAPLDAKITAIEQLVKIGSADGLRSLIRQWTRWIAENDNAVLVEIAAEQLRCSPEAVLPLVDELNKGPQLREWTRVGDRSQWGESLRQKVLQQTVPQFADALTALLEMDAAPLSGPAGEGPAPAAKAGPGDAAPVAPAAAGQDPNVLPEPVWARLAEWMASLEGKSGKFGELGETALERKWDKRKRTKEMAILFLSDQLEQRELLVSQRLARQLAEMSEKRFFEDAAALDTYNQIRLQLQKHVVPPLAHRLPGEADLQIRESVTRVLANVGELQAIDALTLAVVGEERNRSARQDLLARYYLDPSKEQSRAAADILARAVRQAEDTLAVIRTLNILAFGVGLLILVAGVGMGLFGRTGAAQITGALAGLGGLGGVITLLLRSPLDRIQNAIGHLVQLETAFTSFIWELNLNGTYIQSRYVAEGRLGSDEITQTVNRIESAMNRAVTVVADYMVTQVEPAPPPAQSLAQQQPEVARLPLSETVMPAAR